MNTQNETTTTYERKFYRLIDTKTKQPIKVGDVVQTFRGESVRVISWVKRHEASSGKVTVVHTNGDSTGDHGEYYPSVLNAELVPRD